MGCMTVSLRLAFDVWLVLSFVGQTCGYSLGNSSSSALSGKRSETEPFGVEDASKRERSTDVWEFRYYETSPVGKRIRQSVILGDQALYRTEADARKATQALLMRLNDEAPRAEMEAPTFGALLDRYIEHELPERHSTQRSHLSNIRKHIRPRWSDQPINRMKPMAMEQWLRDLPLAPKSKVHIRSLMHLVMKCAERWGVIEIGKNPVALVRVKNASKRLKRPQTRSGSVLRDAQASRGAVPNDGHGGAMHGTSHQRNPWIAVGRLRF